MSSGHRNMRVQKTAAVPYSAEQMYALVNAIEHYPAFLPWCSHAQVIEQNESMVIATLEIAKGPFREKFTTRNTLTPGRQIHLSLVQGPFSRLEGDWVFSPLAHDPRACQISLDLDFAFPAGFAASLLSPVFQSIASRFVEAFCARANSLYGGSLPA